MKKQIEIKPVNITLLEGFTDEKGKKHKDVEISKLITAGEYFIIERIWGNQSPTTLTALILSHAITKFGTMKSVGNDSLLKLLKIDFEDLTIALNQFTEQNGTPQMIDEKTLKLAYGLERNGEIYDVVEFGKLNTGKDEVEAEMRNFTGNRFWAFLAGKEVVRLKQSEGKAVLEGELDFETIGELYLIDALGIMEHSKIWNQYQRILLISENTKPENN